MARTITYIPAARTAQRKRCEDRKLRVAAYCRVSTDEEDQLHSFEAQVTYYRTYIQEHPAYELAGIYADEGISGTNIRRRTQFKQMIADCDSGKIDLIITKSISRFARNTADCLSFSRKLKGMGIPIYFEKENINTMDSTGELLFTILSSLAQDESRSISENVSWGIRSKFKRGDMTLNTGRFLGYDKDENGKLVVNDEQAVLVQRVYAEFLRGVHPTDIARRLKAEGQLTGAGTNTWSERTVLYVLTNEKYCGDALLQKYYTADFLNKKTVLNQGELAQVYVRDNHPAIIDREQWQAVQEEFERRRAYASIHHMKNYDHGTGNKHSRFLHRAFCARCGAPYLWGNAMRRDGRCLWYCKNRFGKGEESCKNDLVNGPELEAAFVEALTRLVNPGAGINIGSKDIGTTDTGTTDTGTKDTGTTDTGTIDTGTRNTENTDTGTTDSSAAEPETTEPSSAAPTQGALPQPTSHYTRYWAELSRTGTPLQKLRARQMQELAASEQQVTASPQLIQLVLEEIQILGAGTFEFTFLEGTRIRVERKKT